MSSENALQKQAKQSSEGLANAPMKKKIGFFSAMMIAVGSCIGAGIFFKAGGVLGNTGSSLILAIFTWLIAAFAVIAMALALVEIASARNDNLSMIGWSQTFNSKMVYKACKNFMVYIYLPLTYFFMPLYVIMSIQDGISGFIGRDANIGSGGWAIMMAIAIAMSVYFIVVCGFSSKAGNIQNWIITSVKFIPLVLAVVLGFWSFADNGGIIVNTSVTPGLAGPTNTPTADANTFSFASLTPGFGMFIAIAAIFFAYDGFYVAAGLQSEMKEPKKTPLALLFGLAIVTVIYILIAVAMSLGSSNGGPFGFQDWLNTKGLSWLYGLFQLLIGIGVLGIINGFALWSTRFVEDLILSNEVPFSKKLAPKINKKYPVVGIVYNLVISLPIVVVFCIVGGLAYINTGDYPNYGQGVAELYSFADLMSTWVSVLAFAFIVFAIAGALRNRKTNAVKVEKTKYFVPMAICSIALVSISLFFTFFEPIADLFMVYQIPNIATDILVSRIMKVVILILFIALMIAPIFIENAMNKKKYGSLERAQLENAKIMAEIKGHSLRKEILENLLVSRRTVLENWECKALGQKELTAEQIKMIDNNELSGEADDMARDSKKIEKEVSSKKVAAKKISAKSSSKSKSSKSSK